VPPGKNSRPPNEKTSIRSHGNKETTGVDISTAKDKEEKYEHNYKPGPKEGYHYPTVDQQSLIKTFYSYIKINRCILDNLFFTSLR